MCTAPLSGKSVNTLLLVSHFFKNSTKLHVIHMLHLIKLRNKVCFSRLQVSQRNRVSYEISYAYASNLEQLV